MLFIDTLFLFLILCSWTQISISWVSFQQEISSSDKHTDDFYADIHTSITSTSSSSSSFIMNSSLPDRKQIAKEYYQSGMYYASIGDYLKSTAYLRGACRLDNTSALYWNDLGVSEMRIGQYQRAKKRFAKVLELDPSFEVASQNLADIKAYLPEEEFNIGMRKRYRQQHRLLHLPEVSIDDLIHTSIKNDSILSSPFIIRNAANDLHWNLTRFDVSFLAEKFPRVRVDFYPHNMIEEQVHPYFSLFTDAIRQLLDFPEEVYEDVDASLPGTYIQWNLDDTVWNRLVKYANITLPQILTDDHWIKSCLQNTERITDFQIKTHWKILLIGEESAGMFNHKDTLQSASWQMQIQGRKKWHICSPADDLRLYKAGDVDTFHPDYQRFPLFRHVRSCYQDILYSGDLIYYPREYWHQTLNLDTPTIALSGTIITSQNYQYVAEKLKNECIGKGSIFRPDTFLCPVLEECYKLWTLIYDQETEEL